MNDGRFEHLLKHFSAGVTLLSLGYANNRIYSRRYVDSLRKANKLT
jgi:hypothetical protein